MPSRWFVRKQLCAPLGLTKWPFQSKAAACAARSAIASMARRPPSAYVTAKAVGAQAEHRR